MEKIRCGICKCDFAPKTVDDKTCVLCAKEHPGKTTLEDVLNQNRPKPPAYVAKEDVVEIVYAVLETAGIKRKECEKCGALFFPKSPAQKQCSDCKDKD
jgi:hypothetical protein